MKEGEREGAGGEERRGKGGRRVFEWFLQAVGL
jgi:hypothetical protein